MQIGYDQGDVATVIDPLSRTTSILADALGRIVGVIDGAGNHNRYEYDALGRVSQSTDPRGGSTSITYDENGNIRTIRDARDLASHVFTYDELNRLVTYTDPLGNAESYQYDRMGNITSMTDRKDQITSYAYDSLDRLTTVTHADSTVISIVWDAGDRPRQIIDSVNGPITLDYDDFDRLIREVSPQGQVDYEYDNAGRRTKLAVSGHAPITYDYDAADRLTRIAQGGIAVDLTYDASNRQATVTLPNGIVGTYAFDDADQLQSIVYVLGGSQIGTVAYTYDPAGRRVGQSGSLAKLTMPASVSAATYDAANRLTYWGATDLHYDDNGNLTSAGSQTFSWNVRDQLAATSAGSSQFSYDVFGRRASRTLAGVTTNYLHDGQNPVVVGQDLILSGFGLDEFYALLASSGVTSRITDALGSTRMLTNQIGNATASYAFAPYGAASRSGSGDTSLQFTGRENDAAANLYYYRARYYSAELSRFISEDPAGFAADVNFYAYGLADPVTNTDPTGEFVPQLVGAVVGVGIEYLTNPCADLADLAVAGALGALGGGLSKAVFLRYGPGSITRETGKEWSHSIPRDVVDRFTSGRLNSALNRRGGLNGSWASPRRHYQHDSRRWPQGWDEFGRRFPAPFRALDRTPDWLKGSVASGGAGAAVAGGASNCGC